MAVLKNKKKILFIVEGEKAEPTFLRRTNKTLNIDDYEIFSFKTSIYELYDELKNESDFDILLFLKEKFNGDNKSLKILNNKFESIFLIFDYDPQHQKFSRDKITEMVEFFNDSTDGGKLLISFPMIEDTRHLKKMPDESFIGKKIDISKIKSYKKMVGEESYYRDLSKYNYNLVVKMILHHLVKFNYLIFNNNFLISKDDFFNIKNWKKILDVQNNAYFNEQKIFIISEAFFYIVELKPKLFFNTKFKNYKIFQK